MPSVAISHTDEKHRSFESVLHVVREALSHVGGIDAFVKPGQTVLIKPDQSVPSSAEAGCTTDPLVVGALIRLALEAGAAKVRVAESSADRINSLECMRSTGMAAIAGRLGAELTDLGGDAVPNSEVDLPGGRILGRAPLPVPVIDADVIIAVPKAKNHYADVISGVVQLWAGLVNQNWRALHCSGEDAIERLADIMTAKRPDLCVVDALICGEGNGPLATQPHWCGCILVSADPVATDVAIAQLLGHKPGRLLSAAAAEEHGLGARSPIVWLGPPVERYAFQSWPARQRSEYLPAPVLVGRGVTVSGALGNVKSAIDMLLASGDLEQVIRARGTPTIMIGEVEDPEFERRVTQGPYLVFDDAAKPKYKYDPRVSFIPSHPVLHAAMPGLMRALGITRSGRGRWFGGSPRRRVAAEAASAALAAVAFGVLVGAGIARR